MHSWRRLSTLTAIALAASALAQAAPPTIDAIVSLRRPSEPALSPDGRAVAYSVLETDWDANEFRTQLWLVDVASAVSRPLTSAKGSSSAPAWSPDGRTLAFLSDRSGKSQVWLMAAAGGEAWPLTDVETGVSLFSWSPDGAAIAYLTAEPRPAAFAVRDKEEGAYEVVGEYSPRSHLFVADVARRTTRRLTGGPYAVGRFAWSPDGTEIAFDHRPSNDANRTFESDLSIVRVADAVVRPLVSRPGPDQWPRWSPDGRTILFFTSGGDAGHHYFSNGRLATIPAAGGSIALLATTHDELTIPVDWDATGIYARSFAGPFPNLYLVDPATGRMSLRAPGEQWITSGQSFDRARTQVAFVCANPAAFDEICLAPVSTMQPRRLTRFQDQLAAWPRTSHELFRWTSKDGTPIEGVLHKPAGFQEGRRYPLLVVIHGGPSSYSRPAPVDEWGSDTPYPIEVWLRRGAVVLEPNYRGSLGYGARFKSLIVGKLGQGEPTDVVSGVDALVAKGIADNDRVGIMGWSYGGYLSALVSLLAPDRFKAASVGAGITSWELDYTNTDIDDWFHAFFKATPWSDPEVYAKGSPMTYIRQARVPTLIQHGDSDPRVPVPNARELYRALQDLGVPSRMIFYKGMGHILSTPRTMRAAMTHNVAWFDQYLLGTDPDAAPASAPTTAR